MRSVSGTGSFVVEQKSRPEPSMIACLKHRPCQKHHTMSRLSLYISSSKLSAVYFVVIVYFGDSVGGTLECKVWWYRFDLRPGDRRLPWWRERSGRRLAESKNSFKKYCRRLAGESGSKSDEFSNVHTLCRRATKRKRDYDWLEHRAPRPLVG